jgi:hypothetical protein
LFVFPTLFNDNTNGCCTWTTALHDGVGGSSDRIAKESKPANRAGITLTTSCTKKNNKNLLGSIRMWTN